MSDLVERDHRASPTRPAAASTRVVPALHGPVSPAVVLGVFDRALYLDVGSGGLLPVVAPGGLRLPTAVCLASPPKDGWGVAPGDRVHVGAGRVRLPGTTVEVVRTWAPERVPAGGAERFVPPPVAPSALRSTARELTGGLVEGRDVRGAVADLVGAGPGLTPSGDDVLCGVLLALRLVDHRAARDRLWSCVEPRLASTTMLSAALLREAADGYAVPPVVRLATALDAQVPDADRLVRDVLAIGHSSGADLLAGLVGALEAVAAGGSRQGFPETGALIRQVDQCPSLGNRQPSPLLVAAGGAP